MKMTNRERLQRLEPVDRYRFLKNALNEHIAPLTKNEIREDLSGSDGNMHLFNFHSTPEGRDYWWKRIKIMEA